MLKLAKGVAGKVSHFGSDLTAQSAHAEVNVTATGLCVTKRTKSHSEIAARP
jgi:hypothetical protein